MDVLNDGRVRVAVSLLALVLLAGCGGPRIFHGHGIVHEISAADGQALIEHDEIVGLMPAMTMSFTIDDPALLTQLQPGDVIDFELTSENGSLFVTKATVVGKVRPEDGWTRMGNGLVKSDPAPPFSLSDTDGHTVSLAGLAGRVLLVDFIFTRCPGPCPLLTSTHVQVQKELSPALRARTHFVSITLDPLRDTPADLEAYARARGADLSDWSFLTGPPDEVDAVVKAWGAGTTRSADGDIEHVLATFLVDDGGRIVKRYLGQDHAPEEIAADLQAVAFPSESPRS